jgi:flagellar biosynthesis anti-sigma factor FlgM
MKKPTLVPSQSANNLPSAEVIRAARVKAIQQAVASGTYQIDDRALAHSLLRDLLGEEWERIRFFKSK